MHDVISKTLPHQTPTGLEEIARLSALWGQDAMNGAAKAVGMAEGELWSWARLKQVDDHLQTLAAMKQDTAMLKRDDPKPAEPAPAAEDPLAEVRECIDELVEFASEDALSAGYAIPGGLGCRGPDVLGMELHIEGVIRAVRKLLGQPEASPPAASDEITLPDWLLVEHKPGARVKGGSL